MGHANGRPSRDRSQQALAAQVEALNIGAPSFVFSTTQTNRHASEIAQLIAPQGRFALIDGLADAGLFMRKSVSIHWELMFTRPLFNTADIDRQHTLLNEVARLVDEGVLRTTDDRAVRAPERGQPQARAQARGDRHDPRKVRAGGVLISNATTVLSELGETQPSCWTKRHTSTPPRFDSMQHIRSEIDIAASADTVWRALADFSAYPVWNPFVRSISGEQTPGARLKVTVQPEGEKVMSFRPRLLVFEPKKELRWKGQVLVPGIFDGEHYFQLTEPSPGRVHFVHGEVFSGLLAPLLFHDSVRTGTERGFAAMNQALRARAEAQQRDRQPVPVHEP